MLSLYQNLNYVSLIPQLKHIQCSGHRFFSSVKKAMQNVEVSMCLCIDNQWFLIKGCNLPNHHTVPCFTIDLSELKEFFLVQPVTTVTHFISTYNHNAHIICLLRVGYMLCFCLPFSQEQRETSLKNIQTQMATSSADVMGYNSFKIILTAWFTLAECMVWYDLLAKTRNILEFLLTITFLLDLLIIRSRDALLISNQRSLSLAT